NIALRIVDGVVDIKRLTGTALGGEVDLKATFNGRYNIASLTSSGQVTGLDLAQALSVAEVEEDLSGAATLGWAIKSEGATVTSLTDAINGAINLALVDASYNGQPLILNTEGDIKLGSQRADLSLAFGLAEMKGDGRVVYAGTQSPQIDAKLHLNLLDPALLALAGPDAAAEAEAGPAPKEGADEDLLPLEALREIDTHAILTIDKAVFEPHTINNLKAEITAKNGLIKISTLKGDIHGGQLDARATLDARGKVARMATQGGLRGVDIPLVLKALDSDPIMAGSAITTWQLNSRGNTPDDLIANLKGPAKLTTKGAILKDVGIEKMLCQAVALVNQQKLASQLSEDSVFKDLSMDIELGGGKARLKPLRADLNDITLRGNGVLNLLSEDFNADFTAKLGAGLGKLDPACKINERYAAVDWPVTCKGKISGEPADWCGVDTGKIIEEMATYEAKRKLKKEAGKLLDGLLKR
ncbi:MAG: AsmA-like C-terminal region-containing protein, partial [Halieaceae bacterium]